MLELSSPFPRVITAHPSRLSLLFAGTTSVIVVVTFLLAFANQNDMATLLFLLSEPSAALIAGLIIARRPNNIVGWLILGHVVCFVFAEFARQYALYGVITQPGALPLARPLAWFAYWLWMPGIACWVFLLPFYFPNGRLVSPRWRWPVGCTLLVTGAISMLMAVRADDIETPGIPNPLGGVIVQDSGWLATIGFRLLFIALSLTAITSLVVRYWRASSDERKQLLWLVYAIGLAIVISLLDILPFELPTLLVEFQLLLALQCVWVAIGIAVLKYRLYDIDIILNRTLVYGTLTTVVIAIYTLLVGYLGALFQASGSLAVSLVATGVVAVLFQPLRERLQRGINRLLYGDRDEPYAVLARLGRRLGSAVLPDTVPGQIVETVATALKLPYAALALEGPAFYAPTAEYFASGAPRTIPATEPFPLTYQGDVVGQLWLAPRREGEGFSPADRRLLIDLLRQAGVAVSAARLTVELQHARERLVNTREEERRRLRRDLHDGLGPTLAAQTLKLGTARYFLQSDPATSDRLLAELEHDVHGALGEVRRLVYNLRPPALDDLGLAGALRRLAAEYDSPALQVVVDTPEQVPPLSAAVEVAVYRIVQEALANVVRHSQASQCSITLAFSLAEKHAQRQRLVLTVVDNGVGLQEAYQSGVGLRSMRERAEELGGTCAVGAASGSGTQMIALLPL